MSSPIAHKSIYDQNGSQQIYQMQIALIIDNLFLIKLISSMQNKIVVNLAELRIESQRIRGQEKQTYQHTRHRIFNHPVHQIENKIDQMRWNKKNSLQTFNIFRNKLEKDILHQKLQKINSRKPIIILEDDQTYKIQDKKQNPPPFQQKPIVFRIEEEEMFKSSQFKCKSIKMNKIFTNSPSHFKSVHYENQYKNLIQTKCSNNLYFEKKHFRPTKSDLFNDMGTKFQKMISRNKLNSNESQSECNTSQILEVMTIFSIKQPVATKTIHPKKSSSSIKQIKPLDIIKYKHRQFKDILPYYADALTDKVYSRKIHNYLMFLNKINYSNNIPIQRNIKLAEQYSNYQKIKVYVGNGNNKYLIIALLKRRFWYEITSKITKDTKFIWTQNSIKQIHATQKIKQVQNIETIHNESCEEISKSTIEQPLNSKQNYKMSIQIKKDDISISKSSKLHPKVIKNRLQKRIYNYKIFLNSAKAQKSQTILSSFHLQTTQFEQNFPLIDTITNHIPNNSFIGSKKALFHTMEHYYRSININPFTIIPKTYHFTTVDDPNFGQFLKEQKKNNEKSVWIIKPGQCTNRGNGIYLLNANDITRKLLKQQVHPNGQQKTTIVQSYIASPLLYNGRKFDIRHYMMITVVNHNLKAYWYSEGYLRTSSELFSLQQLKDPFIHLTNDAIQKTSQNYGKYQPGNKLSYNQFQRYLDNHFIKKKIDFKNDILCKMKQIALDVVRANYLNLDKCRRLNNFQIFGMDFMIDAKFQPWLIQINANPCLQISCPLLSRIIPIMVQHSLRLALDPHLIPKAHYPPNKRYYLSDNFLQNLRYEIIFDELQQPGRQQSAIKYNFDFDEPQDEYQNEGNEIDLANLLD